MTTVSQGIRWLRTIGLIGGGCRSHYLMNCQRNDFVAIRPCRESARRWWPDWQRGLVNQSSYRLNEHGPELNVFWTRSSELGVKDMRTGAAKPRCGASKKNLTIHRQRVTRKVTKKRAGGNGSELSALPFLSVQIWL